MAREVPVERILRAQAWERAKGELQSMLVTFYSEPDEFAKLQNYINKFTAKVESEGLEQ